MSRSQKYAFFLLLGSLLALFIYSLFDRRIHVDEGVLAEPSFWLAKDGYLHSEVLRGWQHAEDKFLFTHKLYLYVGALFIKIFGWSSATLKSTSLFYFLGISAVGYLILKYLKKSFLSFAFFLLLLITNTHIFELAFVYRPEMSVALGMISCWFFLQLFFDKKSLWFLILAGFVAALGIGHHLNGVIIPGASCLLLLYRRQWGSVILFGCIATLGFGFHLLGISSTQDFQLMISQFRNMQDISSEHFSALHYVVNILDEQRRYLHSPGEIAFTIMFLPILFLSRRFLWKEYRDLCVYTISGALCLAIIAHGKDSKYLVLLIPLITMLVTLSISYIVLEYRKAIIGLVSLYLIVETSLNIPIAFIKDDLTPSYRSIGNTIPDGAKILAPIYAVFWAVPKYRMQSFIGYQFRAAHQDFNMNIVDLNNELNRHDIDYVIFDEEQAKIFEPTEKNMPDFELKKSLLNAKNFWLYQRKENSLKKAGE